MHCKLSHRVWLSLASICCLSLYYYISTQDTKQNCIQEPSNYLPSRPMLKSEERLSNLQRYCKTQSIRQWSNLTSREKQVVGRHIIVDDRHRLLYCYIPKVACSNWKRVFMVLTGRKASANSIKKVNHKDFVFLSDFSPLGIQHRLRTYYKFLFTREPMERLVSAYRNKFLINNKEFLKRWGPRIINKYRHKATKGKDNIPTLAEFFQYLLKDSKMDEHWMTYMDLCQPCAISYDFIGSFDCLHRDAQILLSQLSLQNIVQFPTKQSYYTVTKTPNNSFDNLLSQVPRSITKKVVEKYSQDYKLFSFPKPKF